MKKLNYFLLTIGITMMTACNQKGVPAKPAYDLTNLDTTTAPGADFYQYACGGWMKNNPLKPEFSRYGTFDALGEENREQLKSLVEEISNKSHDEGTIAQKIGTLYNLGMDSAKLNSDGAKPIAADLAAIAAITDKSQLPVYLAKAMKSGFGAPFGFYIYADDMNSSLNIAHLTQGGLSLPEREYYLATDESNTKIRAEFVKFVAKMFLLADPKCTNSQQKAANILKFETQLAKAHYTKEALRDPMKNYHKITLSDLQKSAPGFDWIKFFSTIGLNGLKELNVAQTEPIQEVARVLNSYPLEEIKTWLSWQVINHSASFLSDDFEQENFNFYGKALTGTPENRIRWKRVLDTTDGVLGEAIGQMYVEKYFPAESKEKMLHLVDNLKAALGERINGLAWMSDSTKQKAQEKLAAFRVKIGYPDKWRDYSKLTISEKESYYANVCRANAFEFDYMLSKAGKPVDKDEWLMTPQTVNAYYNPTTNEICFPAAILQPPFFNPNADDAINYGAIGVVIGHEMSHGFDDQGRQFDKEGNLKEWWNSADTEQFNKRTAGLVAHYDNILVAKNLHANGSFTLGENIADQGGLQISFAAFQKAMKEQPAKDKIDGFTPNQRFFLSYANVWAGNIRDKEIVRLTQIDPHSLGKWRVNGALPHIDAWYDAFKITPKDPLYLSPDKRVVIW